MKTATEGWRRPGEGGGEGTADRETDRQVGGVLLPRRCGQAVTNHRFPFRYSRHFIGRARTKSGAAVSSPLLSGPTHVSLQLISSQKKSDELSSPRRNYGRVNLLLWK